MAKAIDKVIDSVENANNISDIPNITKMQGHNTAYRIRSGNYRIGIYIENETVIFTAFDHRKNIYKKSP